ncbi:hypothetical protein Syun_007351 [Stephania yunnanensis]|uniref:Uncharacterized protein n=1 Tax=Stephania yunnanensis TaxID=152371 RepID=A0AAP0L0Y0_9MAGN
MITIPYTTALTTYIAYGLLFAFGRFERLIPQNLRLAAYVGVMQRVSASDRWGYEARLRVYRESDLSQEKNACPNREVEEFFASRSKTSIERTLKQSLERVRINANWVRSVREENSLPRGNAGVGIPKY